MAQLPTEAHDIELIWEYPPWLRAARPGTSCAVCQVAAGVLARAGAGAAAAVAVPSRPRLVVTATASAAGGQVRVIRSCSHVVMPCLPGKLERHPVVRV